MTKSLGLSGITPAPRPAPEPDTSAWDAECARAREKFEQRVAVGEVDELELAMIRMAQGSANSEADPF